MCLCNQTFIFVVFLLAFTSLVMSDIKECKVMQNGRDYHGRISVTKSGHTCQRWDEQYPQQHSDNNHFHFPDPTLEEAHNYCRNPDEKSGGPWCYTTTTGVRWDFCDVPQCTGFPECKLTKMGTEYRGMKRKSSSGQACVHWYSLPYYVKMKMDLNLGEDDANYCRNPDSKPGGPWCFTENYGRGWEYCNVTMCEDKPRCKKIKSGEDYRGSLSMTVHGRMCQRWDIQAPHRHPHTNPAAFGAENLADVSNFCRNPDNSTEGPWCHTTDPVMRRDYCSIPLCSECENEDCIRKPIAKHVVHFGIDGLRPDCLRTAPGGAPNIFNRIGKRGIYTLVNARTTIQAVSAPGWSTTLCGMRPTSTGVENNAWKAPWLGYYQKITPITGNYVPFPCVFATIKAQAPHVATAAFYDWDWLPYITSHGIPGSLDRDYFHPTHNNVTDDGYVAGNASQYLHQVLQSSQQSYTFVYFGSVDHKGHTHGWCGKDYEEEIRLVDGLVGKILDIIDDLNMTDDVLVMLSADHGGEGKTHGFPDDACLHIPMFIRGPSVKVGYQFLVEVRNEDIAPTGLFALNLQPNAYWKGKVMSEAFTSEAKKRLRGYPYF